MLFIVLRATAEDLINHPFTKIYEDDESNQSIPVFASVSDMSDMRRSLVRKDSGKYWDLPMAKSVWSIAGWYGYIMVFFICFISWKVQLREILLILSIMNYFICYKFYVMICFIIYLNLAFRGGLWRINYLFSQGSDVLCLFLTPSLIEILFRAFSIGQRHFAPKWFAGFLKKIPGLVIQCVTPSVILS